jgi:hypothetical protein
MITTALIVFIGAMQAVAPAEPAERPNRFVAIGCISRPAAAGPYILTDARGGKPAVYRLDGDANQLKLHVGHVVEITGPLTPPSKPAKGPTASAPLLKVGSLTWISKSCK